jgi:sugar lactone lactonase YvrE
MNSRILRPIVFVLSFGILFWLFPQSETRTGYCQLLADPGSRAPVATALFTYTNPAGVLISQAGVAAVVPILSGRIFVDQQGTETGIALVNASQEAASVMLILRDPSGREVARKPIPLDPGSHLPHFVSEWFPSLPAGFTGSLTFESARQIAAITLRQSANARNEYFYTTLPVIDLAQAPKTQPVIFPQIAAGDGYATQIILINSTTAGVRGSVALFADNGSELPLRLGGADQSRFAYDIAANGTYRVELERSGNLRSGYAVVTPEGGSAAPNGSAVFRYSRNASLVTETGVAATEATKAMRVFVDNSGSYTGVALANSENRPANVRFTLLDRDGNVRGNASKSLLAKEHIAAFAHELFPELSGQFTGLMEITSDAALAAITLKLTENARGDLVYATLPVADLNNPPVSRLMIFPQMAFGGGFSTRLIFISVDKENPGSGALGFFDSSGSSMTVPFGDRTGSRFPYQLPQGGGLQFFPGNTARIAGIVLVDSSTGRRTSEIVINEGNTAKASLVALDESGAARDEFALSYRSNNPTVAAIDAKGNIAGKKAGFSTITVSSAGVIVTGTITVVGVRVGVAGYDVTGVVQDLARRVYLAASDANAILLAQELGQVPQVYAGIRGTAGLKNDVRLTSLFRRPGFLALDLAKATLYVSDGDNHVIRRVEAGPEGKVATLAGMGVAGYKDGPLSGALFNNPGGIALDSRGHLWVVDTGNHAVRRIDLSTGAVETMAGRAGSPGWVDGKGDAARFNNPIGIAIETDSVPPPSFLQPAAPPPPVTVVVADTGNGVIRRVSESGLVETIGSDSSGAAPGFEGRLGEANPFRFQGPVGIAIDPLRNIYVTEPGQDRIQTILSSTLQVVPAVQPGTFREPRALAVSQSGKVLVGSRDRSGQELLYGEPAIADISPASIRSQGGTEITIKGSNFSSETIVIVMGEKVEGAKIQDTETISFKAPALPSGITTVTVQNRGGIAQGPLQVQPPLLATLPDGYVTTFAGGTTFNDEGKAAIAASTGTSSSIVLDGKGNLYVPDEENNQVRRIDSLTGIITTVAGMIGPGQEWNGGPATATFVSPNGIAFDSAGNMFLSERIPCRIRRVDAATGIITTVAGTYDLERCPAGCYSGDGVPAKDALLYGPRGLWVDAKNNLFIADTFNHRIRRIDAATGIITTIAGNGAKGYSGDGGPARDASFDSPCHVAVDLSGNVYISDTLNNRIRRVDAGTQSVSTIAGTGTAGFGGDDGPARSAILYGPGQLSFDSAGNLYVVDWMNNRVRRIAATGSAVSASGIITTVAGNGIWGFGGDGGPATSAAFRSPWGITVDGAGRLYIADTMNNRVRLVDTNGRISTILGNGKRRFLGDNGPAWAGALTWPNGIAADPDGNLYIADQGNRLIRKVDATTGVITTFAGSGAIGSEGDNGPATEAAFYYPRGIASDSWGNIFIADTLNHRIRRVDASSKIVTTVAGNGDDTGSIDGVAATRSAVAAPRGLALDVYGNLFIAETGGNKIRKVDAGSGYITTIAGTGQAGFSGDDGMATAAALNGPSGIAIDTLGNFFIADTNNHRVRLVTRNGVISTVAGNGKDSKDGEGGPATAASIGEPSCVIVDSQSNLYISGSSLFDERIVKVDLATKRLTRITGGQAEFGAVGDGGPSSGARFWTPVGLAIDRSGNLLIADETNDRIRIIKRLVQRSNLQITFSPNPVAKGSDGAWHYEVHLLENGGVGVTLTKLVIDGSNYTDRIPQWFGSNRIEANGQVIKALTTSGSAIQAFNLVWEITGSDDKGNTGIRWISTLRCLP